jgi:hypothetical protein
MYHIIVVLFNCPYLSVLLKQEFLYVRVEVII